MAIPLLLLTRDEMCTNRLRGNGPSPGQVMRGPMPYAPKLTSLSAPAESSRLRWLG
jgi:hypothetical protein